MIDTRGGVYGVRYFHFFKGREENAHKMNLIGLTSSRRQSRTNAYTARILLFDGNVFSICVRSRNRTRIVVYTKSKHT